MKHLQHCALALPFLIAATLSGCGAAGAGAPLPSAGTLPRALHSSAVPQLKQPRIHLGSTRTFAILAGSTVTNTGSTQVTGDVGIFPGTAITGIPPGVIHGTLHAGDGTAKQAQLDLTQAYNNAMGRVNQPIAVAGNLGGQTLYPGLYKSTSGLAVSSGDLTLDARGNRNAVFIFQTATTFNMTAGRKVLLTRGARARNIYWAIGSSATFGTGDTMFGNLLVHQSISFATGTVLKGRALARIGAVTMQGNTLVRPAL
jgi:hypothetical protein